MSQSAGWSVQTWCYLIGGSLLVIGLSVGAYILVKVGKRRRMTDQELKERILNDDITDMPTYSVAGPGIGVRVEASATTDTMRELAAEGKWKLFWSWPICTVGWTSGAQFLITGLALDMEAPIVALISGIIFVPAAIVWAYRPFGVLAEIKAQKDIPSDETPESMQRRW